jgi:hypothetical protein
MPRAVPTRLAVSLVVATLSTTNPGHTSNRYLEVVAEDVALSSPAYRYANLTDEEAVIELDLRGVRYRPVEPDVPGVRLPIRLAGPLHGVDIHSALPEEQRAASPFEILDARLALALDDLCAILARHEIVELVHFTIYRPAAPLTSGHLAPQFRHPGALAIDVGALRKRDGQWLRVAHHWTPALGAKTCGPGARELDEPVGHELQSIVCEAAAGRIFTYMLTPHFDRAHSDHLHLEVKPGVKWFLVN